MEKMEKMGGSLTGLLSVREAAKYLGLSTQTVYNRVSQRKIDHIKLGARVLFRLSDLEKLIEVGIVRAKSYGRN